MNTPQYTCIPFTCQLICMGLTQCAPKRGRCRAGGRQTVNKSVAATYCIYLCNDERALVSCVCCVSRARETTLPSPVPALTSWPLARGGAQAHLSQSHTPTRAPWPCACILTLARYTRQPGGEETRSLLATVHAILQYQDRVRCAKSSALCKDTSMLKKCNIKDETPETKRAKNPSWSL